MEVFNLDIIPGKSAPVIHASQFDAGREFKANLFEGPTVYTLSGAETLSVIVRKPDGNMVTAAVTNTSDSYITFETTEQMTACDGANLCELRIENGADVIGSINFIMEVEKSPDTGITSASEIHNLEAQVDAFTAIAVADQYDSANVIFDNSPTPGHGNGYAVTSEGVATALGTKADTSSLATVATTGNFNDLSNKPTSASYTLAGLSDTNITTPSDGQILTYDGSSSKWIDGKASISVLFAGAGDSGFRIQFPSNSRFTIFAQDVNGRVTSIVKKTSSQPTITDIAGSYLNTAIDATNVYLRSGEWDICTFIVSCFDDVSAITVSVYS